MSAILTIHTGGESAALSPPVASLPQLRRGAAVISNPIRDAARHLRSLGYALTKPLPETKRPAAQGWSKKSADPERFTAADLLGIMGGPLSDGGQPGHATVIIDLDDPVAVTAGDAYLPATGMVEGRASKPRSHRYFLIPCDSIPDWAVSRADQGAKAALATAGHAGPFKKSFHLIESGACVLDFLGTGGQAVCPPSLHPSGEPREWNGGSPGTPAVVPFMDIWTAVCKLACDFKCWAPSGLSWPWEPKPTAPTTPPPRRGKGRVGLMDAAVRYLAKIPDAITNFGGHDTTMWAARCVCWGFDLGEETGFTLLNIHFNPRCKPQWSERELKHKCHDADTLPFDKPRGWLRDREPPRVTVTFGKKRITPTVPTDEATPVADPVEEATPEQPPPEPGTPPPEPPDEEQGGGDDGDDDFDPEGLFRDEEELERLAELSIDNPAEFAAEMARFRRLRVSIRDLNSALKPIIAKIKADRQALKPPEEPSASYFVKDGAIHFAAPGPAGIGTQDVPICNFDARIVAVTTRDDGAELVKLFTVEGKNNTNIPLPATDVPTDKFGSMGWVNAAWGNNAIINAGTTTKDHVRAAIQTLSGHPPERTVYGHTGWRRIGDQWVYLHGGGAIGAAGPVDGVDVHLSSSMAEFTLPPTGDDLKAAVRASLQLIAGRLAPDRITMPLLGAVYRAPLESADFAVHLNGETGSFKSELAALAQQHYGTRMNARKLPMNWSSTANAIEMAAFVAKDGLLVVDDFNPTGAADPNKLHQAADRIFRAAGNATGRARLNYDLAMKEIRPPRGLILSTGEDTPKGHSCRARLFVVEVEKSHINTAVLTQCQQDAHLYAEAMAGYLRWLAPRYGDKFKTTIQAERVAERNRFAGAHARTPGAAGDLMLGITYFARFAFSVGVISAADSAAMIDRGRKALGEQVEEQAAHLTESDPTDRFLRLIPGLLASGRAHVTTTINGRPDPAEHFGWREEDGVWKAKGNRVGWIDHATIYLMPEPIYSEVQRFAAEQREPITMGQRTLWKRMHERGQLTRVDTRNQTIRYAARKTFGGRQVDVLHFDRKVVFSEVAITEE